MSTAEYPAEIKPVVLDMDDEGCLSYTQKNHYKGPSPRTLEEARRLVQVNRYRGYDWQKVLDLFARKGSFHEAMAIAKALGEEHLVDEPTTVQGMREASLFLNDRVLTNYHQGVSERRTVKHVLRLVRGYEVWAERYSKK